MATNDGGPAFPWHSDGYLENQDPSTGMSIRDYMAAKAMAGIMASPGTSFNTNLEGSASVVAHVAYIVADAMLAAREVKP